MGKTPRNEGGRNKSKYGGGAFVSSRKTIEGGVQDSCIHERRGGRERGENARTGKKGGIT